MSCLRKMHLLDEIEARFTEAVDVPPVLLGRPLVETRGMMLDAAVTMETKDSVWRELIGRARQRGDEWQLAALWMMVPGLRGIVARCSRGQGVDTGDLESEAVTGFLEAAKDVDLDRDAVGPRLWWKVMGRVRKVAVRVGRELPVEDIELTALTNGVQEIRGGDPLDMAVQDGVISGDEAELIDRTRIEGERLGSIAARLGLRYHVCQRRRARAEGRLAGYLRIDGRLADPSQAGPAARVA